MRLPRYGPRLFGDPILPSLAPLLGVVALMALLAYLLRDRGAGLAIGLLAGVLAAAGVAFVLAPLRPIGALMTAARPLGVPLLLVLAAGTVDSPFVLQLAAGVVAMLVAGHLLVRPELPQTREWLSMARADRRLRRICGGLGILLVVGVVITAFAIPPGDDSLEARGGLAGYLFTLAVTLLGVAAVLRLIGYARNGLTIPVAVCLFLLGVRLAMEAGLLPGDRWLDEHVPSLTVALLSLAAAVLLVSVIGELLTLVQFRHTDNLDSRGLRVAIAVDRPRVTRPVTRTASAFGLVGAIAASVVLFGAMVLAANPGKATGALAGEIEAERADQPVAPGGMSDLELAEAYSPVLMFESEQNWTPVSVTEYLDRAGPNLTITDWEGRERSEHYSELTDCPDIVSAPCFEMTIRCQEANPACDQRIEPPDDGARLHDGVAYVRVVRRGRPQRDRSPDPFANVGEYGERTKTLVQYWYFYPYDDWVSPVIAGQLRQWHQADWEAITIGFGVKRPLFVAFSQHCAGQWYDWEDVRVADEPAPRLHPLVAVATGSQANYRYPNASQAPDWTGCARLPPRITTLVSYASNIRDRTGADWSWTPARHIVTHAGKAPMSFLGKWAPFSRTRVETLYRTERLGGDAAGPATPSLQALWREPMRTIFKTSRWSEGKD